MTHPYEDLKALPEWNVLENALEELEKNDDLSLRTNPEYVVGYLLKKLVEMERKNDSHK